MKSKKSKTSIKKNNVLVAIVIPTYNEAENLPEILEQLKAEKLNGLGLIIVDDGSPDGTGRIAEQLAENHSETFRVIHRKHKLGLGTAYITGFREALKLGAEYIVQMDADLSHPPKELRAMLLKIEEGADIVIGSRYIQGGGVDPNWNWLRRKISFWGGFGIKLVLGLKIHDTTSGFKVFRRSALELIKLDDLRLSGYGFQPEVSYRCQKKGLKMVEHPFIFLDRKLGQSKMSIKIVIEAFFKLLKLRLAG